MYSYFHFFPVLLFMHPNNPRVDYNYKTIQKVRRNLNPPKKGDKATGMLSLSVVFAQRLSSGGSTSSFFFHIGIWIMMHDLLMRNLCLLYVLIQFVNSQNQVMHNIDIFWVWVHLWLSLLHLFFFMPTFIFHVGTSLHPPSQFLSLK